jgi:signal transduction histidine kinase
MRIFSGVACGVLLLTLLTWLLLRGTDTHEGAYTAALQALNDFQIAEASLHRDILQARAGLLHDYDSFGRAVDGMEKAAGRLRSHAESEGIEAGLVDQLLASVAKQEQLTERFKTDNALLQNSISYIGLLSTSAQFAADDAKLSAATGALAATILRLLRDTSSDAINALQGRIDEFDAQAQTAGPSQEAAQSLLAHARLLRSLLPEVDATLKALSAIPTRELLEANRARFTDHQIAIEAVAQRYRLLLYLASLLLLVVLARLALQLRARALALRRRAAFEHVIATNSTRLINCPPAEIEERVKYVLADIASAIGVERAYVVLDEKSGQGEYTWCSDGTVYPPGWPKLAAALFTKLGSGSDILTVPDVAALPSGEARKALEGAGVCGWACVPLTQPGGVQGMMGFDCFLPASDKVFPLPVVRLAGDVVANALQREFLERDRSRLATRLERARRMQTIGSLASGIAHNFNNIISAILGYAEMVEPQLAPATRPAQHVEEIRRAAERGRDLVDHILTFGRRREARASAVQVHSMFQEAGSLLRATLPEGVELTIDDVPPDVIILGEPAQLQQVILNLCTNAAQAMAGKGIIRIEAERKVVTAPVALSHGAIAAGAYVCIAVSDTGPGFDERVAQRLFEPFFTTRLAGTGLGLATVREIVRDHEGALNVHSTPGRGSRFEVWLSAAAMGETTTGRHDVLPFGRGETILVIEDEQERLLRREEMLAALGYEPVGFSVPDHAIAACHATPDRFDAVLLSSKSPTQFDLHLAQTLREALAGRPVLLATFVTDVNVDAAAIAGISEVLARPLVSTELAAALARCLRAKSSSKYLSV